MLSRNIIQNRLTTLYADQPLLQQQVEDTGDCPDIVTKWMARLKLLYGVPINYLVPDEGHLSRTRSDCKGFRAAGPNRRGRVRRGLIRDGA